MKTCKCCREAKPATLEYFHRHKLTTDGLNSWCKPCVIAAAVRRQKADPKAAQARRRAHIERDKQRELDRTNRWRRENVDRVNARRRELYAENGGADRQREYRARNPQIFQAPARRLRMSIHAGICEALRSRKAGRRWETILGYTVYDLVSHLERQFKDGMSWANYGEWHIDHRRPIASFDLTQSENVRACWALDNLQPLWAVENLKKGARYKMALAA